MIDEQRPARRTVLGSTPAAPAAGQSRLTGNGRGLMLVVLATIGASGVAVVVLGALAFGGAYTGVQREMARRFLAMQEEAKGLARVEHTEARRSAAISRVDSDSPAARVPIGDPARWIVADDYPVSALRANVEGVVSIAWTVGSDGLVTDCVATASSGHADLDRAACNAIARRGRYPAVEISAKPRVFERRVVWQIPD
ncbi:TonB family protein [Sphingomonas insulae]|uniref:TonB C-terminal domain-containing protein n=1 Tax=Sphingomonas insulae TaxID=424800 RepID=A0ABN1HSU7_9SPHN|nr:energy transducer TonB [Sphingomonas insulae]NIJ28970.1 TonB family protein [Sphingomonas insulae]